MSASFLFPVLYLAAMGVGLGSLIDHHAGGIDGVRYLDFLAPGLLAGTVLQIAVAEATYPVVGAVKWTRVYWAMLASPLGTDDLVLGFLVWIAVRMAMVSAIFLGVMAAFGTVRSPLGLLVVPVSMIAGVAFAAPVASYAVLSTNDQGFAAINRFIVVPLFLFSTTFFPLHQLPVGLRVVAQLTPLFHGVNLTRALCLGQIAPLQNAADLLYLVVLAGASTLSCAASFKKRLVQ